MLPVEMYNEVHRLKKTYPTTGQLFLSDSKGYIYITSLQAGVTTTANYSDGKYSISSLIPTSYSAGENVKIHSAISSSELEAYKIWKYSFYHFIKFPPVIGMLKCLVKNPILTVENFKSSFTIQTLKVLLPPKHFALLSTIPKKFPQKLSLGLGYYWEKESKSERFFGSIFGNNSYSIPSEIYDAGRLNSKVYGSLNLAFSSAYEAFIQYFIAEIKNKEIRK